jgi:hypothetical protein
MDRHTGKKPKSIKSPQYDSGTLGIALGSANAPKIDYPIFCFRHLINGYSLDGCNKEQKAHFVSKLAKMAQQTWDDLDGADHWSGSGFEKIPKDQIKGRLPAIVTEDVEKLYVMRFNGKHYRMIGHRSDHIYYLTHVDITLSAYGH